MSKAGTPAVPRLPKPAEEPQRAASVSFSPLFATKALEELEDAKRVANEFMVERASMDDVTDSQRLVQALMRWLILLSLSYIHALVVFATLREDHGKREISHLSTKELRALARSPNPAKSFNIKSSTSHLSKILIPRARQS